ncbi:MAG: class I SAM-dependent methyltransferase [Caldilineaceae bacterium SB0675_bin_29]|uniref:Class I SAM-dependent methyltransferase n=1 Tax=Caldilineaceae bacterium SB0675_bin_29 TaxID=2605266 RepID=A0A6B1FYI8_9CHLR|nr:class I SAM-dependent methyltransferase [Caldilineaceae bacterium SB0675_bin_29]
MSEDRGISIHQPILSRDRMNFDAFARFYDGDYRDYRDDIPLVLKTARAAGRVVLELGCGTGRVLLPLVEDGCHVTGIDTSAALLAIARRKLAEHGYASETVADGSRAARLVQADMTRFQLPEREIDFAFVVSNTLMHLTTQAEQLKALQCAQRHLRAGGLLLIDLFNPDVAYLEAIAGIQELADWWEDGESGATVLKWATRSVDAARQLQETVFVYEEVFPDGHNAQTRLSFPLRFWWPDEGTMLLERAGFAVDELYGDFDGSPYRSDSERLIFIARKR